MSKTIPTLNISEASAMSGTITPLVPVHCAQLLYVETETIDTEGPSCEVFLYKRVTHIEFTKEGDLKFNTDIDFEFKEKPAPRNIDSTQKKVETIGRPAKITETLRTSIFVSRNILRSYRAFSPFVFNAPDGQVSSEMLESDLWNKAILSKVAPTTQNVEYDT